MLVKIFLSKNFRYPTKILSHFAEEFFYQWGNFLSTLDLQLVHEILNVWRRLNVFECFYSHGFLMLVSWEGSKLIFTNFLGMPKFSYSYRESAVGRARTLIHSSSLKQAEAPYFSYSERWTFNKLFEICNEICRISNESAMIESFFLDALW